MDEVEEYDFDGLTDRELFNQVKHLIKTGYADEKPLFEAMLEELKKRLKAREILG